MAREGQIDRQKHEVDIAERVLEGGVGTESTPAEGARIVAIEVGVQPGPLRTIVSAVQVQTADLDPDKH